MLRGFTILGVSRLISAAVQAIVLIVVARLVGVGVFGELSVVLAVLTFVFLVAGAGLPQFIVRERALGEEVVDIEVDGCKVFLRTAASQAASAAPSEAAPVWEQVLEPDFHPFFTACQRESLQVSKGVATVVTVTLGRMAMGAGGCCATGGTYPSRDGRIWKKS